MLKRFLKFISKKVLSQINLSGLEADKSLIKPDRIYEGPLIEF